MANFFKNLGETLVYGKSNQRAQDELDMAKRKAAADYEVQRREAELATLKNKGTLNVVTGYMSSITVLAAVVIGGLIIWKLA